MCESTVLLKEDSGLRSVMVDAVKVAIDDRGCVCIDPLGRSLPLDGTHVVEIDLRRHRIILERA
ncbi:MAG: CooT family nickel-binding protein [Methanomassiliicoccus sp.]|nr:CooT family nickel-binding protein [Methanomassiliicoccus sp.]